MTQNSVLIEMRDLHCERDERVLFSALSARIRRGEVVQIDGPNGSGKTTLLRILTTSSNDYGGSLLWRGEPVGRVRLEYLSHLLYIGHLAGIKKALTPRENLSWYTQIHGAPQVCGIGEALVEVGLSGYEDIACFQLSAGQLRRVALARLYLAASPLWILDEPFTSLDRQGVANLEKLIRNHADRGGCVILTSHQTSNLEPLTRLNILDFKPELSDEVIER